MRAGRSFRGVCAGLMLAVALAGCSGADGTPTGSPAAGDAAPTPSSTLDPIPDAATDPDSPLVVAAATVGERSIAQVSLVHGLAASVLARGDAALPAQQRRDIARTAAATLDSLVDDATMMAPVPGSAAEALVESLRSYADLARALVDGPEAQLPAGFGDRLVGAEATWRDALEQLSGLAGRDLTAQIPDLAVPAGAGR